MENALDREERFTLALTLGADACELLAGIDEGENVNVESLRRVAATLRMERDRLELGLIVTGVALDADTENRLEDEGLIVQTDNPYAHLTDKGRDLLGWPERTLRS